MPRPLTPAASAKLPPAKSTAKRQEIIDTREEAVALHVVGVGTEGLVTQRDVLGVLRWTSPSAEIAHPDVADGGLRNPSPHLLAAELRVAATARKRPHVDDSVDPGVADDRGERVSAERAVSERVHRCRCSAPSCFATSSLFSMSMGAAEQELLDHSKPPADPNRSMSDRYR